MSNQVFEIVQAMSGQGNCITIPGPYLDFFVEDRQQHLLAAILNQLVFWSGKSTLENGWFYKEHAALAREIRAKNGDVVRKAIYKITKDYLPEVIAEELRQVNGTPTKHYRIDQDALIARIFPSFLDSALKTNGNGLKAECKRHKSRMESAQETNPGIGSQAESYLYTDLKNRSLHTDHKNHAGEILPVDNFAKSGRETVIPEANLPEATADGILATDEDFDLAMWFWSTIIEMYERAAEFDGTLAKPREPNFVAWANEVRMLRQEHGCSYDQIRTMIERIQRDQFWCPKVQTMKTLRNKWPELALKLCPVNLAVDGNLGFSGKVQADIPKGFRG